MTTKQLGNIGEANTIAKFVLMQVPVYPAFGDNEKSDLIADFNGKLNKIQIKTTESLHDGEYMTWKLTHQEGYHGNRIKYSNQEVDYFALYCIETKILCLVPFEQAQTNTISIRLDSYQGKRLKTMRFVSEYQFESIIK